MPLTITQPPGGIFSSLDAGSTAAAPAVNTVICDSGVLSGPHSYKVVVVTYQVGTVDANQANVFINVGGINTAGIISAGTTIGRLQSTGVQSQQVFRVMVLSGQRVYVCTGNSAGGAGSIYTASMTLTQLPALYSIP